MASDPVSSVQCEFCPRKFQTVAGLRIHALRTHAAEIDAAKMKRVGAGIPYDIGLRGDPDIEDGVLAPGEELL